MAPKAAPPVDTVELAREVSSLGTQVKIMWAIGAGIIAVMIWAAQSINGTTSELNRTIGTLSGQVMALTNSNKSLDDQVKTLNNHLLETQKSP